MNLHLGGRHVLNDVHWRLGHGEHWACVGPNGSGKSTLLRVIAGTQWIDPGGGTRAYSADGTQLDSATRAARWIRLVSPEQQERYVRLDLPILGRDLVASGVDDAVYAAASLPASMSARIDELIARFELAALADRPIRELSSGQLRRLLIARALAQQPAVLVLDEFSSGLDRGARREVLAFLDRLAGAADGRLSLIVASHRADDFPAAITHTATVRHGRVSSAVGRPAALPRAIRERPRLPRTDAPAAELLVRVRHADLYRGETLVLRDVCWELRRGQHTAIRGANGSGKSTFATFIAGTLVAATGADVERFGRRGPFDVWELKRRVALVSDDLQTAYDRGETVERVIASGFPSSIGLFVEPDLAQREAVAARIDRLGLHSLAGRRFTQLSFGERRKVLIARSLVHAPELLVLDEVWNGLDRDFRSRLIELLSDLARRGTTLMTITHDDDEAIAALSVRTCTIAAGRITCTQRE